ncbi:hypothetical protein [Streptomyces sp. NPDC058620]|uniref:hypothetical protein n=1 Tax=Streptomyces sp. NPDC058620 TaxID=3346560 RepID=UPI0036697E12
MALLAVIPVPVNGGLPDMAALAVPATALGDTAPCGPGRFLFVRNADAASHTVTVATPGTVSGLPIPEVAIVVAAGKSAVLPLAPVFRGTSGRAAITYNSVTAVTVAVLELGQ